MVELTECIPCQYGDHEHHQEVVQAVPEGMMGGARCPCTGECVGRERDDPKVIPAELLRMPEGWPT